MSFSMCGHSECLLAVLLTGLWMSFGPCPLLAVCKGVISREIQGGLVPFQLWMSRLFRLFAFVMRSGLWWRWWLNVLNNLNYQPLPDKPKIDVDHLK